MGGNRGYDTVSILENSIGDGVKLEGERHWMLVVCRRMGICHRSDSAALSERGVRKNDK